MSVGSDLLRFSDRKWIVYDFESNSLRLSEGTLPFQVSWVVAQRGRVLESHSYYLKWPNYVMSPDAARITRFNPAWVANGDDPEFVLDAWESYAMDPAYLVCGQNTWGYDNPLWDLWRRSLGRTTCLWDAPTNPYARMLDSNLLGRAHKCGWKPDRSNLEAWFWKVYNTRVEGVKTSLGVLAKDLGVEVDASRQHDATYDVALNVQILWKLINLVEI